MAQPQPASPAPIPTPAALAAPVSDLAARLASMAFRMPFRRYQELALQAFERARAAGDRRVYLTMPPGSGKTLLGLEIARRLGRPTLVLGPNTAIQAQWVEEWSAFGPPDVAISTETSLASSFSVLTYQAVAVLERAEEVEREREGERDGERNGPARNHREVARRGDRDAVLGLLHANGRALIQRLAALGPCTLILDECHHLLELWGHVLEVVIGELDPASVVVGLTATPPTQLGTREAGLYSRLFGGSADFEVVTPAVVREGYLAPYQELAYLVEPLPAEREYIAAQQARFDALLVDLLDPSFATTPFGAWFAVRVLNRRSADGVPVGWSVLEHADPGLAQAALRWCWSRGQAPPPGAHLREQHRRALEAADWMALIEAFTGEVLDHCRDPIDLAARERIRHALTSVGYVLTRQGIRAGVSVVDRLLALSGSKAFGAARILGAEHAALGDGLRALVLCDYETAGREVGARLRGVLDPGAGSAALLLRTFLDLPASRELDPVLVTGRTVACSRSTAHALVVFARKDPELAAILAGYDPVAWTEGAPATAPRASAAAPLASATAPRASAAPPRTSAAAAPLPAAAPSSAAAAPSSAASPVPAAAPGWDDPVLIDPAHPHWTPRTWVPLVTAFFESGGSRCLVGTRALLGEGWDSRPLNVLIDLGAATTSVSVHQVRGRTLRLDPAAPHKVADNWDVVCVAPEHARGSADYARFARKHRDYFALTARGEIESGVSHVDPSLSPFGPPNATTFDSLDATMLGRVQQREGTWAAWGVGQPYRDVPVETVRVHLGRSPGLPGRDLLRASAPGRGKGRIRVGLGLSGLAAVAFLALGSLLGAPEVGLLGAPEVGLLGAPEVGLLGALVTLAAGSAWGLVALRDAIGRLRPSDTLEDMARALAEAMAVGGIISPNLGPTAVRVLPQPDGYYRCFLDGAADAEARAFAEAFDELVSPLWEPRWIIPRRVATPEPTLLGTLAILLRRALRRLPRELVVYHAVPGDLAVRRERALLFEAAWRRWVSPGARALPVRDPKAQAVLELHRGDDPFAVETQMRTLWT